jgi:DNA polymerase epsilon subunit 2
MLDKVPRAHFASNPAKIRYFSQDLVFFREDLQAKMRRNCLIPPDDTKVRTHVVDKNGQEIEVDAADRPTFQHLAATLVQQAHLCPLPITQAPIYWEFDHALWLYPAPTAIFLGDRTEQQSLTDFEDTVLTNPGCFGGEGPGEFLTYCPATGVVQFSAVP